MKHSPSSPVVIRVPDGDLHSALAYGVREANIHGCGLRLVRPFQTPAADIGRAEAGDARAAASELLRRAVVRAREAVGDDVEVTSALVIGPEVESVIDVNADARVVVLEHRDILHLARALARSATDVASSQSRLPIVSVPVGWTPAPIGSKPITVGVKAPERSRAILRQALAIAHAHRTSLRLLHTWSFPPPYDDLIVNRVGPEWEERARLEIDASVAQSCGDAETVDIEIDIRHGHPGAALVECSSRSELLILERRVTKQAFGSHLSRVAREALHGSHCPVLLLPTTSPRIRPPPRTTT